LCLSFIFFFTCYGWLSFGECLNEMMKKREILNVFLFTFTNLLVIPITEEGRYK
jgi:hypothetical protein